MTEKLTVPRYWVCIIGPIENSKLPDGSDGPPRIAARRAVLEMTGDDPTCNSGWVYEADYRRIIDARYPGLRLPRDERLPDQAEQKVDGDDQAEQEK